MANFDYTSLSNVVKQIKRNTFGVCCIVSTEPKMNKTNNPYYGRVRKVSTYTNVAVGRDYYVAVDNSAKRQGLDASTMVKESPRGQKWVDYPYFLESMSDASQHYLRLTFNLNSTIKSVYYIDGVEATPIEVEAIKAFIPTPKPSAKQSAIGLDEEHQVKPISPKVENIVELRQGSFIYKR